jgi:hypothetical protein
VPAGPVPIVDEAADLEDAAAQAIEASGGDMLATRQGADRLERDARARDTHFIFSLPR